MKNIKKIIISIMILIMALCCLSGCIIDFEDPKSVISIDKTQTIGDKDFYTITYNDGSTQEIVITNGSDGKDLTVDDLFNKYLELYPNATYEQFLKDYLSITVTVDKDAHIINKVLSSTLKIYSEFVVKKENQYFYDTSVGAGSGVIYAIDDNNEGEDYTYIITNYHVCYSADSITENGIARKITAYLYGSEDIVYPKQNGEDSDGFTTYEYGSMGIDLEYVGGSVISDIAVLRVKTENIKKVNENITSITFASEYHVGDTAIAVGNPEDGGLSVTKGIVSVDNEDINLNIDNTIRAYRCMRIDTPTYKGSSGGGLFNINGELIGITNAGDGTDQNVNFAIPVTIIKPVVENIIHYGNGSVNKMAFGFIVVIDSSKYEYNQITGYGEIIEQIRVYSVDANSIAKQLGIKVGDILKSINVNSSVYALKRRFEIGDLLYTVRVGDVISVNYVRNGVSSTTTNYTVQLEDIVKVQ